MNHVVLHKLYGILVAFLCIMHSTWFITAGEMPNAPEIPETTEDASKEDTPTPSPVPTPSPTPTVQPTPSPAAEVVSPAPTPTPTPTAAADTPTQATPTPSPTPDATPATTPTTKPDATPTPTPAATETPSPTPTIAAPTPTPSTAVESAPPAPEPEKKVTPTVLPPITGIDTVDIEEGGNWLLKRKALEDTADTIEKIINDFSKILEASTSYKIKRNKLDNDYDLYIATIGFNLGDLDQVLTIFLEELEKDRKEDGDLTADERGAIATINEKKNEIKQLQDDLKALNALDEEIDKVVDTVDSQIKTANNYQNQAWKNFQQIKKVLSDEKAEELYYRTISLEKSMKDIYSYLTGTLSSYFTNQITAMRGQMDTIKGKVQDLQNKGVDLKKKLAQFEQEDEARDQERAKEEQEDAIEKALKQEKEKELAKKTAWWVRIKSVIVWPFVQIKNLFSYIGSSLTNLFKGKPKAAQAEVAEEKPAIEASEKVETPTIESDKPKNENAVMPEEE